MTITSTIYTTTSQTTVNTNDIYLLDASSNDVIITLSDISVTNGIKFIFTRTDTSFNTCQLNSFSSSQTINGSNSYNLNFQDIVEIVSFGGIWYII